MPPVSLYGSSIGLIILWSRTFVEYVEVEFYARLVRYRKQMQHAVGRTAERHVAAQRVGYRSFVYYLARRDAVFDQIHDRHARVLGKRDSRAHDSGYGAVAGQSYAYRLAQTVHAVGGIHTAARTARRTALVLILVKPLFVDHIRLVSADRLEHFGQRDFAASDNARKHRTSADHYRGDIHPDRRHDHAGNDLVAVGNEHDAVEHMRGDHRFHAVGDEFARRQRIVHAVVSHRYAVAHAYRRYGHGSASRKPYARLDRLGQLVEVDMSGDDLAVRRHDAYERSVEFLFGEAARIKQRSLRSGLRLVCQISAA